MTMIKKILGISRSPRFSPNSTDRDAAIFAAVTGRLQRCGTNDVNIISEDLFVAVDLTEFDVVYSMARGRDVLAALAEGMKGERLKVLNNPEALLRNDRATLERLFSANDVPVPLSVVVSPGAFDEEYSSHLAFPLWVKRGDGAAQTKGDVRYVEDAEGLARTLEEFARAGYGSAVLTEHVAGDLVKFYGVEGTDFFFYAYPTRDGSGFSKFGLEKHNGAPQGYPLDADALKRTADRCAGLSGFTIYGGDAVVTAERRIQIIDFNDWPSFGACRKAAARAIAQRINNE